VTLAWFVLALAGAVVQMSTSSKTGKRKKKKNEAAA
jgi:hypothetical protein